MSITWTVVAVLAFLATLAAHEAAHAVALYKMGGKLQAAGMGLPLFPVLRLPATKRRPFELTFSPWLIAAYVEPDEASVQLMKTRSYLDKSWYAAAGVIINAIIGFFLLGLVYLFSGWTVPGLVMIGLAAVIAVARRPVSAIVPFLGIGALVLVAISLASSVGQAQGPVGIAQELAVSGPMGALQITALISVSLAVFNCIPIYPLDGGRVVDAGLLKIFGEKVSGIYRFGATTCALVLLLYVVGSDAWSLIPG